MHGEDDQICSRQRLGEEISQAHQRCAENQYPGRPHGLTATRKCQRNFDFLPKRTIDGPAEECSEADVKFLHRYTRGARRTV